MGRQSGLGRPALHLRRLGPADRRGGVSPEAPGASALGAAQVKGCATRGEGGIRSSCGGESAVMEERSEWGHLEEALKTDASMTGGARRGRSCGVLRIIKTAFIR